MSLMYVVNPGWLTRNPFVPKRKPNPINPVGGGSGFESRV